MAGINGEHQFDVLQTEFISTEKAEFTWVSQQHYFPAPIILVRPDNGTKSWRFGVLNYNWSFLFS
jgi:hypothetical protein